MLLPLFIHPCIRTPPHDNHPRPLDKPLRVQIQGPLVSIEKLLPNLTWHLKRPNRIFPQPAGLELAKVTFKALYGRETRQDDKNQTRQNDKHQIRLDGAHLVVRDEYLAWVMVDRKPLEDIDYYGVTFDHLVPADDINPEVLAISIIEVDDDGGAFADEVLPFKIDPTKYTSKKVLAVPRCCQIKKGTQDRGRINGLVIAREQGTEYKPIEQ